MTFCKRILIAASLLIVCATVGFAQSRLHGIVFGADSVPLRDVAITLLQKNDSTYVRGTVCNTKGEYDLGTVDVPGNYLISAHAFNHVRTLIPASAGRQQIFLEPESSELAEVVVTAGNPTLAYKDGKLVCVPRGMMLQTGSVAQMLDFVPMLSADDKANVSVEGRGMAKIYINGKDPHLSSDLLAGELQTYKPEDVASVEIVVVPGASLDPSEGAAIVNIKMKNKYVGFRGMIYGQGFQRDNDWSPVGGTMGGYANGKFKLLATAIYRYTYRSMRDRSYYDYFLEDRQITNTDKGSDHGNEVRGSLNFTYEPTSRATMGVAASITAANKVSSMNTFTTTVLHGEETPSSSYIHSDSPMGRPRIGLVAFYDLQTDDNGSMLKVKADYGNGSTLTKYDRLFGTYQEYERRYSSDEGYSAKADYSHRFKGGTQAQAGASGYHGNMRRNSLINGVTEDERYSDWRARAFMQVSHSFGFGLYASAGVEVNYAKMSVNGVNNFGYDFTYISPSADIVYSFPKGNHILTLSYTSASQEPSYRMLNPYKTWTSDNSYEEGNPDLKPYKVHYLNLYYRFLNAFSISMGYHFTNDNIIVVTNTNDDGITVTRFENGDYDRSWNAGLSYGREFFPFWNFNASINTSYYSQQRTKEEHVENTYGWAWSFRVGNRFILSKRHKFMMGIDYRYESTKKSVGFSFREPNPVTILLNKQFKNWDMSMFVQLATVKTANARWNKSDELYYYINPRRPFHNFDITVRYFFGRPVKVPSDRSNTELDRK